MTKSRLWLGMIPFIAVLCAPLLVTVALAQRDNPLRKPDLPADRTKPAAYDKKDAKPKFDPIQVNGRYFEGWQKPKLAILVTGRQHGYLEPCGCAGLENQKGGISRRHALIQQLEEKGWKLLCIDVGGLVRRFGKQAEIQFGISVEALKKMDYQAVGFGPEDLRLSAGDVAVHVAEEGGKESIFVSANVNVFGMTPRVKKLEMGGKKIGITAVLGDRAQKEIHNPEIGLTPAADALKEVMPQLKDCNLKILLAYATLDETNELAKKFPEFDIVVTGEDIDEPAPQLKKIDGTKAQLVEVGHKGMYATVLGIYDNPKQPIRYQRVALDSRFPNTPEMKDLMVKYQTHLQGVGWEGLSLRAVTNPRGQGHDKLWGQYAGSEKCQKCHAEAFDVWKKSKHAHATDSLVKADPPRQHDPECLSCHVTGWNPQEFFPYATGFVSIGKTPQLVGNGCENCHGPAAAHVAAENGKDIAKRDELRKLVRLQLDMDQCIKCHDLDNSPEFNKSSFEKFYWPEIEH